MADKIERIIRSFAGAMILVGTGLSLINKWWILLTAFVGLNLFQSGISGWCLLEKILEKKI